MLQTHIESQMGADPWLYWMPLPFQNSSSRGFVLVKIDLKNVCLPSTFFSVSKYHFPIKESRILGETVDSRAGQRKYDVTLVVPESKVVPNTKKTNKNHMVGLYLKKLLGPYQRTEESACKSLQ